MAEVQTRHALLVKNKTFADGDDTMTSKKTGGNLAQPVTIREESDDEDFNMKDVPSAGAAFDEEESGAQEDKKKLRFNTTYDGFNIWGFVLCLLVDRTGGPGKKAQGGDVGNGQALMEEWISTQQAQDDDL